MADQKGMALPLVLLLLIALGALGHGALTLSRGELHSTWTFRTLVRAGNAAEIGLHLGFQVPVSPGEDRSPWVLNPLISGATQDGMLYEAGRRWLDGEFFLLEGTGRVVGWPGSRKIAWLGWSLDPTARMKAFLSAVEVGGKVVREAGTELTADDILTPPAEWPAFLCEPFLSTMDSLFSSEPPFVAVGPPSGVLAHLGEAPAPALGLLSGSELIRRSSEIRTVSRPTPTSAEKVLGSGPGIIPTFHATGGDLELDGVDVFGLTVVGGTLRLSGESAVKGLVLVGGDLVMEDEARIHGMARVRGHLVLRDKASFQASGCPVLRTLWGIPSLREPLAVSKGMRLE